MYHNFANLTNGKCLFLPGCVRDRQGFSRLADPCSMRRDVNGQAFTILWKESDRFPVRVFCQTFFLGETGPARGSTADTADHFQSQVGVQLSG